MSYKCKHFVLQELVPKHIYEERGESAWELLDERMLKAIDSLRDLYGVMIINDWHKGGKYQWRGLRTTDSPEYSPTSQHSFGRGFDLHPKDIDVVKIRQDIMAGKHKELKAITGLELRVSWLHVDCRNFTGLKTFRG